MRIAVLTHYRRKVAGTETYLDVMLSALGSDHEFSFVFDREGATDRPNLTLPDNAPIWMTSTCGTHDIVRELKAWKPDLIYCHGIGDPKLEAQIIRIAPAILTAHTYYGTCISGTKTRMFPVPTPCNRNFGIACLLNYFPRRCGGLNPLTMASLYRLQRGRQRLLDQYKVICTLSEHMRQEFIRHGFDENRVVRLPPLGFDENTLMPNGRIGLEIVTGPRRLAFLGRFEQLKGGHYLIKALPQIAESLGPLHLTFAGDGPEIGAWKSLAEQISADDPRIAVEFLGWLDESGRRKLLSRTDALAVPSIWPEPYGLVGLEAARFGVPSVAFDVGGIHDWLHDSVNGCLAPADPPTVSGFADAVVRCLRDESTTKRLSAHASESAASMSRAEHVAAVREVFDRVVVVGAVSRNFN